MKRYTTVLAMLAACSPANGDGDPSSTATLTAAADTGISAGTALTADDDGPGSGSGDVSDDGLDTGHQTKFDLDGSGDFCSMKDEGVYCDSTFAIECNSTGGSTGSTNCLPGECVPGFTVREG